MPAFANRILDIDLAVALRCAALRVPDRQGERDALIAATALVHRMTVVTRNVTDFESLGVSVINPWLFQSQPHQRARKIPSRKPSERWDLAPLEAVAGVRGGHPGFASAVSFAAHRLLIGEHCHPQQPRDMRLLRPRLGTVKSVYEVSIDADPMSSLTDSRPVTRAASSVEVSELVSPGPVKDQRH